MEVQWQLQCRQHRLWVRDRGVLSFSQIQSGTTCKYIIMLKCFVQFSTLTDGDQK